MSFRQYSKNVFSFDSTQAQLDIKQNLFHQIIDDKISCAFTQEFVDIYLPENLFILQTLKTKYVFIFFFF